MMPPWIETLGLVVLHKGADQLGLVPEHAQVRPGARRLWRPAIDDRARAGGQVAQDLAVMVATQPNKAEPIAQAIAKVLQVSTAGDLVPAATVECGP